MKTIYLFSLLLSLTIFGCTKTAIERTGPSLGNSNIDEYSTLIVGQWQLSDIGTVTATCPDPTCPMYKTEVIFWTKNTSNETLNFKSTGEFTKETANDDVCKGTFRINRGQLYINAKCEVESSIRNLTQSALVLGAYKYMKI